mgnify:CR=1 FL=1
MSTTIIMPSEPTSSPTTHVTSARCTTNTAHRAGPFSPRTIGHRKIRSFQRFVLVPAFLFRRRTVCASHRILLHQQRGWSGVEASRSSLLSGQSEQLLWQRFNRCSPGRRTRAPISKRPSIRRFSRPHTTARQHGWRRSGHRAENRPYPRHGQHAQLRPEPAGQP